MGLTYIDKIEELTYELGGLTHSTDYSIKVRAVNAEGESDWSETLTATTLVNNPPVIAVADTLKVNENVVDIGTITATDKDGDDVVLAISSSQRQDFFSFNADTGMLSFVEPKSYEDYENTDSDGLQQFASTYSFDLYSSPQSRRNSELLYREPRTHMVSDKPERPLLPPNSYGNEWYWF